MRKSEMVDIIFKALKKWDNCKIEKRTARDILNTIIKTGMLPPEILSKDGTDIQYKWEKENK